jgi:ATP-binding cassette subfamily C (CFTR/MRP) protein 1
LIQFTENKDAEMWKGYLFAALFFVSAVLNSFFFHQLFHIGMTLGMRVKAAVIAAVYEKVRCFVELN